MDTEVTRNEHHNNNDESDAVRIATNSPLMFVNNNSIMMETDEIIDNDDNEVNEIDLNEDIGFKENSANTTIDGIICENCK